MTFQSSIKSESSNRVQYSHLVDIQFLQLNQREFSQSVDIRFSQCNQRESSPVPSSQRRESGPVHYLYTASSVQFIISTLRVQSSLIRFYRSSDVFWLDTEFNDIRKWRGINFQILSKTRIKNRLDQPSQLRISHQTSIISKITTKTQLTTFAPLDSINHQANVTRGNYKGTSKFQFDFQFHDGYSFHNLIVNKHILYQ